MLIKLRFRKFSKTNNRRNRKGWSKKLYPNQNLQRSLRSLRERGYSWALTAPKWRLARCKNLHLRNRLLLGQSVLNYSGSPSSGGRVIVRNGWSLRREITQRRLSNTLNWTRMIFSSWKALCGKTICQDKIPLTLTIRQGRNRSENRFLAAE